MAGCTALSCPRLLNTDPDNRAMSITIPSDQITRDKTGQTWCNFCQKHRELMDYGHNHHWPAVRVKSLTHAGYYAITGDASSWFAAIALGNQDAIDAYYAELIGEE